MESDQLLKSHDIEDGGTKDIWRVMRGHVARRRRVMRWRSYFCGFPFSFSSFSSSSASSSFFPCSS